MFIPIPPIATNNQVALALYDYLCANFKDNNAVNININSNGVEVTFYKNKFSKAKEYETNHGEASEFTLIKATLRGEFMESATHHISQLIVECVLDNWLKFGASYIGAKPIILRW